MAYIAGDARPPTMSGRLRPRRFLIEGIRLIAAVGLGVAESALSIYAISAVCRAAERDDLCHAELLARRFIPASCRYRQATPLDVGARISRSSMPSRRCHLRPILYKPAMMSDSAGNEVAGRERALFSISRRALKPSVIEARTALSLRGFIRRGARRLRLARHDGHSDDAHTALHLRPTARELQ